VVITEQMAELVAATWQGPTSAQGDFLWYGLHYDSDLTTLVNTTCVTVDNCTAIPEDIGNDWLSVFLARNSSFDTSQLTRDDFDRFFQESVDNYTSIIGTDNPDLTNMTKAGTKMIAWHGMQDPLVPTNGSVEYYTRAMNATANVTDYYRLFLAPGVGHCGNGRGFDPSATVLSTLRLWVEEGITPTTLPATALAVGSTTTTRSVGLCPYPEVLTYVGTNPDEASSFTCV
jgi:hypothetical protein